MSACPHRPSCDPRTLALLVQLDELIKRVNKEVAVLELVMAGAVMASYGPS